MSSNQQQAQFWDPVKQAYIHYDRQRNTYVYADGTPYHSAADTDDDDDEENEDDRPRTVKNVKQDWGQGSYGTSPQLHHYKIAPDAVGSVADALAGTHIEGSSGDGGDETPTQQQIYWGSLEREPKQDVTDPDLLKKGMVSRGKIKATPGESEYLDAEFRRQRRPKEYFVPGKVFRILWPEHPGYRTDNVTVITDGSGYRGQDIVTKFRWFVVVKSGTNFCSCLPISTYGRRGCTKPSVLKWQHSMVYSGRNEPPMLQGEAPREGEEGMMPGIRVVPKRKSEKMDPTSRIDYSRIYTVDHFVKIKEFGQVHDSYVKRLRKQWWYVFKKEIQEDLRDSDDEFDQDPESMYKEWVTALYEYNDSTMMKLKKGDRIGVMDYTTDDWWKGKNLRTEEENLFPSKYVSRDQ